MGFVRVVWLVMLVHSKVVKLRFVKFALIWIVLFRVVSNVVWNIIIMMMMMEYSSVQHKLLNIFASASWRLAMNIYEPSCIRI